MAIGIVDKHLPKVSVSIAFGDATLIFELRFPADTLQEVTEIAKSVILDSGDPAATVSTNGVSLWGIQRPSSTGPLPDMDPDIAAIMRTVPLAFSFGRSKWEIGMTVFVWGWKS
jgi:hypothetical protein